MQNRFRNRLMLAIASLSFGAAVFTGLILFPAYAALLIGRGALQDASAPPSALSAQDLQNQAERKDISRARAFLARSSPFLAATSSPVKSMETALALRPQGVTVSRIAWSRADGKLLLEGAAPGRDAISAYQSTLLKDGSFTGASVPVDALVSAGGGKFTMTLTGTF